MATITLDFTGLPDTNPYSPPTNWLSVGQVAARIFGSAWSSTGATNTIWIYNVAPTGLLTSEVKFGAINSSDSRGPAFCDASGNGYILLVRSTNARLYKVAAGVLGAQVGSTYSGSFALNDDVRGTLNPATGAFVFYKNNVQFATFTDTTYSSNLRAGLMSRAGGGYIKSVSVSDYVTQTVTSINGGDPFTASQTSSSAVTTGFTGLPVTITSNQTGLTIGSIGGATNAPTFVKSVRVDGQQYPKNGTVASLTFTNGSEIASGNVTCDKDDAETAVVVASPELVDTTYLFAAILADTGRTAEDDDEVYHVIPPAMLTNGVDTIGPEDAIKPNGEIDVYSAGTFTMWMWTAATGINYYYDVTVAEGGAVISVSKFIGSTVKGKILTGSLLKGKLL